MTSTFPFIENKRVIGEKIELILNDNELGVLDRRCADLFSHVVNNTLDIKLIKDIGKFAANTDEACTNNLDLVSINEKIKSERVMGAMKFSTYISTVDESGVFDAEALKQVQGVVLFVAFDLSSRSKYDDYVQLGLRHIRRMIAKPDRELFRALPSFCQPIETIIQNLKTAEKKQEDASITRKIDAIRLLLEHYNSDYFRRKKTKKNNFIAQEKVQQKVSVSSLLETEPQDHQVSQYKLVTTKKDYISCDEVEWIKDQTPADEYVEVNLVAPKDVRKSLVLQHYRAKQQATQITKRNKQLSTDASILTRHEIVKFLSETWVPKDLADLISLLVIFTGKNVEQLFAMLDESKTDSLLSWKKGTDGFVRISKILNLPQHEFTKNLELLRVPSGGKIVITLPSVFSQYFPVKTRPNLNLEIVTNQIKSKLSSINKKFNCRLTLTRLSNYLPYFLRREGFDQAEIALLVMSDKVLHPGNYYYQLNVDNLQAVYSRYSAALLKLANIENSNIEMGVTGGFIGSKLQIDKRYIASLFRTLKQEIISERHYSRFSEAFHNLYVIYTLELLFLATGHRPVRHPFETLNVFDLLGKTVYISDKENRSELSSRMLILPNIAAMQIKNYSNYLFELGHHYCFSNSQLSSQIELAADSKAPLFFFLDEGAINYVTPKNLDSKLKKIFPIKLNWHRHFLRTYLRKAGRKGDFVDEWMGHAEFGDEGFSKYSSLSMKDLSQVAETIEVLLTEELGISGLDLDNPLSELANKKRYG